MWNKLKQWLHPDHITRGSIKEGFDDLPAAVCYFTPDGIIRLCNRQMFRVYRALSGRDLQSLEELHQQVWAPTHGRRVDGKNPSFVLPDGTCWLYSEQTVFGEGVRPHVECIFSEVTDLQRQRQELLRQNQELLRMNRELRRLSENVQEMTREKEILEFKTRLHDEMGYGLTAVRQCLPGCRVALVVDEVCEPQLADQVRRAKKDGLIDGFFYSSVSSDYLSAMIDAL